MEENTLEKVLSCRTLPSLPAVAAQIVELTSDDDVSMRELAAVLQNDQAMAAKLLRTVNSSFYGLRKKCANIQQAIVMLGLNAVKTLALGFSLVGAISRYEEEGGFDHQDYWRRSLYSGMAAKRFAAQARLDVQEEAFLGGLLQDVGMIALHQALGEQYTAVVGLSEGDHRSLIRHEQQSLDVQHPDIGAMLAARWKLAEELVLAIKYHERPSAAPQAHLQLARAVALGNVAADLLIAAEPAPVLRQLYTRAERWFGLRNTDVDQAFKDVTKSARELARLLSLDTGDAPGASGAQRLLHEARAHLRQIAEREPTVCPDEEMEDDESELTDPLTGLGNRRRFDQAIVTTFEFLRTGTMRAGAAIFEVDGLRELQDRYGSDVVDSVMISLGRLLRASLAGRRAAVCRTGEMRFGVVMVEGEEGAGASVNAAEEARRKVESTPIKLIAGGGAPPECRVTLSAGVCAIGSNESEAFAEPGDLTAKVERALEAARQAGGNAVKVYAPRARAA